MNIIKKRIASEMDNKIDSIFNEAIMNSNNNNVDNKSILETVKNKVKKIFDGSYEPTKNINKDKYNQLKNGMTGGN